MNKLKNLFVIIVLIVGSSFYVKGQNVASFDSHDEWNSLLSFAEQHNRMIVLAIGSHSYGGWVKKYYNEAWKDEEVRKIISDWYVDGFLSPDTFLLAQQLIVRYDLPHPSTVIFNKKGEMVKLIYGAVEADELATALRDAMTPSNIPTSSSIKLDEASYADFYIESFYGKRPDENAVKDYLGYCVFTDYRCFLTALRFPLYVPEILINDFTNHKDKLIELYGQDITDRWFYKYDRYYGEDKSYEVLEQDGHGVSNFY
jgi:hypothetical protein